MKKLLIFLLTTSAAEAGEALPADIARLADCYEVAKTAESKLACKSTVIAACAEKAAICANREAEAWEVILNAEFQAVLTMAINQRVWHGGKIGHTPERAIPRVTDRRSRLAHSFQKTHENWIAERDRTCAGETEAAHLCRRDQNAARAIRLWSIWGGPL